MRGAMYRGMRDLREAVALRRSRSTLPFGGGRRGRRLDDDDGAPAGGPGSSSVVVAGGAFPTSPTEWADDVSRRLNDAEIGLTNANREIARLRIALEGVGAEIAELRARSSSGTTTTTITTTAAAAAAVGTSPPSDGGTVVETGGGTREEEEEEVEEDVEDVDLDLPTGTLLPYSNVDRDVYDLSYGDVDWSTTNDADMAPPFIGEDECLVPGEPVIRIEKAPQNSRRIFAGIDIPSASVDDVWRLLTDYPNLQKVVPNLVVNEVLMLLSPNGEDTNAKDNGRRRYDPDPDDCDVEFDIDPASRCRSLSYRMNGAILKQVGGAKVAGINFSARTTLEVREWPGGMPDFSMTRLEEEGVVDGKSRSRRLRESAGRELTRYVFPRPFALSSLPHRDISMQSVPDDEGEFRMYQGVWRMQPLPGCSPPGGKAMRLTYAVEVSPRPYLPVALVEGRIARDLCANLKAIRDIFAASNSSSAPSSGGG
ncbi:hypothetical protein ACHAW5_006566 [Stephanodiscus triporus]|uniref:Coenzyme Q-binding protein COQ10 START domain-containing protein n=1 Tax=Stephanodiscus triporus TaxID=2934178 RepID=A0ABD3MHN5_9STRA